MIRDRMRWVLPARNCGIGSGKTREKCSRFLHDEWLLNIRVVKAYFRRYSKVLMLRAKSRDQFNFSCDFGALICMSLTSFFFSTVEQYYAVLYQPDLLVHSLERPIHN